MDVLNRQLKDVVILGGGPSGLSAGYVLSESGNNVLVIERQQCVGGLAKTIEHQGFRFDLGGHRFLTDNMQLEALIREILGDDLLMVERSSKVLFDGKFYDYPLSARNALSRLGLHRSIRVVADYLWEQIRKHFTKTRIISLEDWVVRHFGRSLFELFFKEYSEKVWGVPCDRIAQEWIDKRIKGLSLGVAIKNALSRAETRRLRTLASQFLYPQMGIGQICDNLQLRIDQTGQVMTDTSVIGINHADNQIHSITVKDANGVHEYSGYEFISSIPLTVLVQLLYPQPPAEILQAAARLRFRDLVVVTLMLDRERVTDLTWMYIHDRAVPFGRIHEPKNWSPRMAPEGKTHLVAEFFCSRGDAIWAATDTALTQRTVHELGLMGLIEPNEMLGSVVLRIPQAYPLFEVNYFQNQKSILEYLDRFSNLELVGRGGQFEYYNTDHAMESGMAAAEAIQARLEHPVGVEMSVLTPDWIRP
ncbi:MAG: NAD(P)-binding protein [bacterium]|nr:NAD(P)-binding protein [bacterium]